MIIQNIARYQSVDIKSRDLKEKPKVNVVSREASQDTYEPSGESKTEIREDLLRNVKKRVNTGFYHSKEVLEDLSDSFAKALNQAI
jgi:hypothetical protein